MIRKVRQGIDRVFDWLRLSYSTFLMFSAALIGVAAGFGALAFSELIQLITKLSLGGGDSILASLEVLPWWRIILTLFIGGSIVGPLVYFMAREAKGHGVPEVMNAVALQGGRIRPRVVIVKAFASAISIGTGGSVGREGPIVQIGSAAGSTIGQWFKVSDEHLRILVACGAAGGIAATFNAPIAGVMFSVEIILGSYAISTLTPLVLSSVIATIIRRAFEGDYASFTIPSYEMVHPFEILPYILLAVLSAFVAHAFSKILYMMEDMSDAIPIPDYIKTPLGMALVGLLILAFPQLYGVGYESINMVFDRELLWTTMLALAGLKIIATSMTLAAGGSGGIFAPSLFIGAAFGGAFGHVVHDFFPNYTNISSAYAVVGMAAVVSGATHAPMTAFLIIFEMTGDYHLILPLMIGAILSSFITMAISKNNIYTLKLARRGVDLSKGIEVSVMQRIRVDEVMNRSIVPFAAATSFDRMVSEMLASREASHFVVNEDGRYYGMISTSDLKDMLSQRDELGPLLIAGDVARSSPDLAVNISDTLADCMEIFSRRAVEELPVVDGPETRRFLGSISQQDIIAVYSREIMRQGAEGVKFIHRETAGAMATDYVDIPSGLGLRQIHVRGGLVGRTLAELDVRRNHKVTVVAVASSADPRTSVSTLPDPLAPLLARQRLILVGSKEDLDAFGDFVKRLANNRKSK